MLHCTKNLLTNKSFSLIEGFKRTIPLWCNAALLSCILEGATIMMKPSQFTQQMIDLQKTSILNLCKVAASLQKQTNSAMDLMLNQAPWIPAESRHAISGWLDTCRQQGDRFNTYVDNSFTHLESCFSPKTAARVTKPAKPSAAKAKKVSAARPTKSAVPAKKATAAVARKAAPDESRQAKVISVEKAATVEPKRVVAAPAKKATPAVTPVAAPVETPPAKAMPEKRAGTSSKESKPQLK
jgi:Na+-transporting NADH:ubiquinone oxidoreductase subunit NqrC